MKLWMAVCMKTSHELDAACQRLPHKRLCTRMSGLCNAGRRRRRHANIGDATILRHASSFSFVSCFSSLQRVARAMRAGERLGAPNVDAAWTAWPFSGWHSQLTFACARALQLHSHACVGAARVFLADSAVESRVPCHADVASPH